MDFKLKTYKHFKIKHYLRKENFFFFYQGTFLKNESWIKIEQALIMHQLKYFRIFNKLMINLLKKSIFKNVTTLIHGPIMILNSNNAKLTFTKLNNISSFVCLLGVRLNYKIYCKNQIKKLRKVTYLANFSILHDFIKTFIKMPYYKFKPKKRSSISK